MVLSFAVRSAKIVVRICDVSRLLGVSWKAVASSSVSAAKIAWSILH
jgi:hypothetical protein